MKIIKVAFSMGSLGKNLGCEEAPEIICSKLSKDVKIEEAKINQHNIVDTNKAISSSIKGEEKALVLGGDHSITYPSFKTFSSEHPGTGLIVLDAHADCQSGISPPTHEDYVRTLVEEKHLEAEKILLLGIRTLTKEEKDFLEKEKICYYTFEKIEETGLEKVTELILEKAGKWNSVYLSVDIDVVNPQDAPGTGYLEERGFTPEQVITLIQSIKKLQNLGIRDLVEINPKKDIDGKTVNLGVKIVETLL